MRMYTENLVCPVQRRRNELWSGGDGEAQHTEMVWTFGKDGREREN